jgi:cytochrome P450
MTSDPKAIQHIYNNSNVFVRQTNQREILGMIMGPGLVAVRGEAHKRQRRVMQPAFGMSQLKVLHPVFTRHVDKVS